MTHKLLRAGEVTITLGLLAILVFLSWTFHNWSTDAVTRYQTQAVDAQGRDLITSVNCASNTTLTCLRGFESETDGTCTFLHAPRTQACYNICYIADATPTCNANGQCISTNATDCLGKCSTFSECDALVDLNTDLIDYYDHATFNVYTFYQPAMCFFGSCIKTVVHFAIGTIEENFAVNTSQTYSLGVPLGIRHLCVEYLDLDFYATYGDCIGIEAFDMDPITNWYADLDDYTNSTYPAQMEMCVFRWKCARVDIDAGVTSEGILKRNTPKKRNFSIRQSVKYPRDMSWSGPSKNTFLDLMDANVAKHTHSVIKKRNAEKKRVIR